MVKLKQQQWTKKLIHNKQWEEENKSIVCKENKKKVLQPLVWINDIIFILDKLKNTR